MIDLLLIVPHPDDEVFGAGGALARAAERGRETACVTLTRGGAGRTLGLCTQADLPELRERELRASLDVLGVRHVTVYDHPDFVTDHDRDLEPRPGLGALPDEAIVPDLVERIDALEPRVVLTFPPNGSNGHPDHVATHRFALAALAAARHRPEALYYYASERPYEGPARSGFLAPDEIRARHLAPSHYLEVGPYTETKLRAMGQHESQARSVLMFLRRFPRRLLVESFHRASPAFPAGDGARTILAL